MKTVPRNFPQQSVRVETGAIQFGDDWPGVFIRGDNAIGYRLAIRQIMKHFEGNPANIDSELIRSLARLNDLSQVLESCHVKNNPTWYESDGAGPAKEG